MTENFFFRSALEEISGQFSLPLLVSVTLIGVIFLVAIYLWKGKKALLPALGLISVLGLAVFAVHLSGRANFFAPGNPVCKGCNVVIIAFEEFKASESGAYGGSPEKTPNIRKFSENSLVFDRAFTSLHWGRLSSDLSLLSGRRASSHKFIQMANDTDIFSTIVGKSEATLLSVPAENGYVSAYFSENYLPVRNFVRNGVENSSLGNISLGNSLSALSDFIIGRRGETAPFIAVAKAYEPVCREPPGLLDGDREIFMDNLHKVVVEKKTGEYYFARNGSLERIPNETLSRYLSYYDSCLGLVDSRIGKVLSAIDSANLSERTVVVISGLSGKCWIDPSGALASAEISENSGNSDYYNPFSCSAQFPLQRMRVPLIIRIPKGPLGRSNELAVTEDLLPTVFSIIGLGVPEGTDGSPLSLSPGLLGEKRIIIEDFCKISYSSGQLNIGFSAASISQDGAVDASLCGRPVYAGSLSVKKGAIALGSPSSGKGATTESGTLPEYAYAKGGFLGAFNASIVGD